MVVAAVPKVVTVGGGHGQASLLAALRRLRCDVTAVVSVADDGGCSGRLTKRFGMPPPGDLRRCLSTIACDRELAARFEQRLNITEDEQARCAGNLALLEAYLRLGSLQQAADWAAAVLRCWGRVVPVAERAGRLAVYDLGEGTLHGETTVAERGDRVMAVAVHGIEQSNPAAHRAIAEADVLLLGPGSFVTSTLAALTTGQIARHVVASGAYKVLVHNMVPEPGQLTHFQLPDYVRLLRDHLGIHSQRDSQDAPARDDVPDADSMQLTVLCHTSDTPQPTNFQLLTGGVRLVASLPDGTTVAQASLAAAANPEQHDLNKLAAALSGLLMLDPCEREPSPSRPGSGAVVFDDGAEALETPSARREVFEHFLRCGEALVKESAVSAPQPTQVERTPYRVTRS